jgi:hypothetical protein
MAVTPERTLVFVWRLGIAVAYGRYKFITFHFRNGFVTAVSLLKSEIATWIKKRFKISVATWIQNALYTGIIVFQGEGDGRGYRNMCKMPRGSNLNKRH